ncbi:hypothetical protein C8J57DRAFT_1367145 [Mycena rebaudengoi]|nr:hypothetical protein C8J57DRAFT_1367145 [Mycena rebaudengoi]
MPSVTNGRLLFNEVPKDYPVPGQTTVYDTSESIDLENVPLNGGILVKTLVLSVDPYMRGKLRSPDTKSYSPAYTLGQPLAGGGIGVVIRSELAGVEKGNHVRGMLSHQEYNVVPNLTGLEVIERDPKLSWTTYIGAAGMPGETAFVGWREYSRAKKGEVVFVSTGAGPVGAMVIQIAKEDGLKVIASAGSEEKVKFMKEIGADVVFNYKTTDVREILAKEGPIDIYWDNVGGDTLDAAMEFANQHSRFIICGMISGYNTGNFAMKNAMHILTKCMSVNGFLVGNLRPKYSKEFRETILPKLASGQFKFTEDITKGLDKVGDVILALMKGTNTGKAIVVVAEE